MEDALKNLGLTANQTRIYLELLKRGESNASALAKKIGMHRSTVYEDIESLVNKGLASHRTSENKRFYKAVEPSEIAIMLDEQRRKIEKAALLYKKRDNDDIFDVQVFEGKDGTKTVYDDITSPSSKEILIIGNFKEGYEEIKFMIPSIIRRFVSSNIKARIITSIEEKGMILSLLSITKVPIRYLPKDVEMRGMIYIYANKVATQTMSNGKLFFTMTRDKNTFKTHKSIFEHLWKSAQSR